MENNKIIVANFKMNHSFEEVEKWLNLFSEKIKNIKNLPQIVVCPSAILIDYLDELLLNSELEILEKNGQDLDKLDYSKIEELTNSIRKIHVGGQDCHYKENGAFTGDISPKMLFDAGCKFVILGHSERRKNHFESNKVVQAKVINALKFGLTPIVCIGENLDLRKENKFLDFIKEQIENSLPKSEIENLIIAYEPIWSIGTGQVPSVGQIAEIADFIIASIRKNSTFKIKNIRILYGGSTNSANAASIMAIKNISGLLVGGASLNAEEFAAMTNLVANPN